MIFYIILFIFEMLLFDILSEYKLILICVYNFNNIIGCFFFLYGVLYFMFFFLF